MRQGHVALIMRSADVRADVCVSKSIPHQVERDFAIDLDVAENVANKV